MKGRTVTLPIGTAFSTVTIGTVVQASLKTKDATTAKERHAVADAALRRFWEAQRNGPSRLSVKQASALAGTLYYAFSAAFQDNPGPAERWGQIERVNALTRDGEFGRGPLMIGEEAQQAVSREDRFGSLADAVLAREGLNVDAESRALLVRAVQSAMESATARLKANSEFDYSPDAAAARFPQWQRPEDAPTASGASTGRLTATALFEAWAAFQDGKKAPNTIKRYRASFKFLAEFLKGRDLNGLSGDDIHDWAEHRRTKEGIDPRSINKNDLVAVSSVFKWAMGREGGKLMAANPAVGVGLTEGAPTRTRERTLRETEIRAILLAADGAPEDPKNPTAAAAKRWCPWLAAYSGARITELTRLTGDDIRMEAGFPVMDFRKTKTGQPRTVPIHEHLVERGFLEFAKRHGSRPLFYDPKRSAKDTQADPAELRSRTVAKWVRETVKLDKALQPDHAWRHTWKTVALAAGIPERISDAITGHSIRAVSRGYEHPTVEMMGEAMKRFPRYPV